jgi:hypothetical protein
MRATLQRPPMGTAQSKAELRSRAAEKAERVKRDEANERAVHKQIDARDKLRCRAYGIRLTKTGGLLNGVHRHHVIFRSHGGETSTKNMCLLGPLAHADVHAGKLQITGNADRALTCIDLKTGRRWISLPPGQVLKLTAVGA